MLRVASFAVGWNKTKTTSISQALNLNWTSP